MIGIPFLPPQCLNATRLVVEPSQSLADDNGGRTRGWRQTSEKRLAE